jgi:hypothetical protein
MIENNNASSFVVIAGLDPAIHSVAVAIIRDVTEWMPGSSPGMTTSGGRVAQRQALKCSPKS